MIRNIKLIGFMAIVSLAMSAMVASGASAQTGVFTAGETPGTHTATDLTGEQYGTENAFKTAAGQVTCTNSGVSFGASDPDGTAGVEGLNVTPSYTQCETGSGLLATVTMNNCFYHFDQPTSLEGHTTWKGNVDLNCPTEKPVEIDIFLFRNGHLSHSTRVCKQTVFPKSNMGHVVYHNKPAGGETPEDYLTLDITVSGIEYEEHGANCLHSNTGGKTSDGVYDSTVRVKADNPNTETADDHDLWISTE